MKPTLLALALFLACCLSGCGFAHDEPLVGNYRLIAVDSKEQMCIGLGLPGGDAIGRIDDTVFAVGWNERFIVAKQHPGNDRSLTHYYYLDILRDSPHASSSECVTGPLTEAEFRQHQAQLKLPDFTRLLTELQ